MSTLATNKQSFQWMIYVGVTSVDVQWIEQVNGSDIDHDPLLVDRFESIYKQAISGLLASKTPVAHFIQAQLN